MRYFKHMEVAQGSSRRGANAASVAQHQSYDVHDNGGGGGHSQHHLHHPQRELPVGVPSDSSHIVVLQDEEEVVDFEPWMWSSQSPDGVTVKESDDLGVEHPEVFLPAHRTTCLRLTLYVPQLFTRVRPDQIRVVQTVPERKEELYRMVFIECVKFQQIDGSIPARRRSTRVSI